MNQPTNEKQFDGIDRVAVTSSLARSAGEAGVARLPADIAAQLERDAISLTLTGESFTKDKAFYDNVAANIRQAVTWLNSIAPMMRNHQETQAQVRAASERETWAHASTIAHQIADMAPGNRHWTTASRAIASALSARVDSTGCPPAGDTQELRK